jgi:hypothetical protein
VRHEETSSNDSEESYYDEEEEIVDRLFRPAPIPIRVPLEELMNLR